ncbi:hypothetical protein OQ279_14960 [Salinimicrobium sp. MT39]|uniref:Lipoprotein n=1 Tax=Salinimicrobium profundisediminis TaxID=2994553 RepID=A0A9X3I2B0_9FLAO|nr:hypothetical protein [Salinimicrobium profundisediminis]MCX2839449.1 hypothetical protein [Salinimicrobium profundisediminis]
MKNYLLLLFIILLVVSCKTVSFGGDSFTDLSSQPFPGMIGAYSENLTSSNFKEAGVPHLEEKIRLTVKKGNFTRSSLRKFNKKVLSKDQKLEIIDSLDLRPQYHKFEISDKIGLIDALNSPANTSLRNYLGTNDKNVILTSTNIYFPDEIAQAIDNFSEIYLVNNRKSSYSLELLKKDKSREIIEFSDGVSFEYGFSAFCWAENNRRQPLIAAFRERNSSCPGNTVKDPKKLKKDDVFDKM